MRQPDRHGPNRRGFDEYLRSLDLERPDPIEILSITGGERQTDSFEVFPKIERQLDGTFCCRFFLHGLRHLSDVGQTRLTQLPPGEPLGVSIELTNPKTGLAIQLTTQDYGFIGWTPRYLVQDLLQVIARAPQVGAKVVRVNALGVPANRRVLVELTGVFPEGFQPMAGEAFQPIPVGCSFH